MSSEIRYYPVPGEFQKLESGTSLNHTCAKGETRTYSAKYRIIDSISIYRIVSYRRRKYRNFRYIGVTFSQIHYPFSSSRLTVTY